MIKYCIFIIFGIILYLLFNTYNGFSIGVPNKYLVRYYYNIPNPGAIIDIEESPDGIIDEDYEDGEDGEDGEVGEIEEGWQGDNDVQDDATRPQDYFRYYQVIANDEDDAIELINNYEQRTRPRAAQRYILLQNNGNYLIEEEGGADDGTQTRLWNGELELGRFSDVNEFIEHNPGIDPRLHFHEFDYLQVFSHGGPPTDTEILTITIPNQIIEFMMEYGVTGI